MTRHDVVRLLRGKNAAGKYLLTDEDAGDLVYRYGLGFEVTPAEAIARMVHCHQTDKAGRPVVDHLARVVGKLRDAELPDGVGRDTVLAVGWLHDVLEDSGMTRYSLLALNTPADVVSYVVNLTRTGQTYASYIERVKLCPVSRLVKKADLQDHLEQSECPETLRHRYERSLAVLLSQP